jgi:hypothetical protein
LTNPDWARFLAETVAKVQQELGLENQQLDSHLYDLLLYEPGSFFLPHRDGEKLDRMLATLVIVLPSSYEGGEIVIRHDGQERAVDFSTIDQNRLQLHFAAFYADCEHEVRPLRKGYRLCLVYNLTLARSKKPIPAPRDSEHVERVGALLRDWAADGARRKLVITLDHQYTRGGVAWDALKGVDRAKARVLQEAARQAGCKAYLGLLTFWESGSAEETGGGSRYARRHHWRDAYDEEESSTGTGKYTMEEVFDSSLTAEQISDREGQGLPISKLTIDRDELLDPEALTAVTPEEDYEGYTGNEGMTLERWYHHAAVFLWPERRHFEILCDDDSRRAVPVLNQMVARWQGSRGAGAAVLKTQSIDLARAILARWPDVPFAREVRLEQGIGDLLDTLVALDQPRLIGAFLGNVLVKDASVVPDMSLAVLCRKYGWETFQEQLLTFVKNTTRETLQRNVGLLEQVGTARAGKKQGWVELSARLAQELVSALEAIDQESDSHDWRSREVDRAEVLASLARALIASDQEELLSRVVAHVLAAPKTYPLTQAHMKALMSLQPWLKKNLKKPSPAVTGWLASCRAQLEALTASAPWEPTDFRRPAAIACECAECAELKQFLQDPRENVHRFRAREERRKHLEYTIRGNKCDLDLATDRRGSPQTLVCTKNMASYRERLKTFHQNQEHLKTLQAIEASLPD